MCALMFNLTSDSYVQRLVYFIKKIQAHFYLCNSKQIAKLKCVVGGMQWFMVPGLRILQCVYDIF